MKMDLILDDLKDRYEESMRMFDASKARSRDAKISVHDHEIAAGMRHYYEGKMAGLKLAIDAITGESCKHDINKPAAGTRG